MMSARVKVTFAEAAAQDIEDIKEYYLEQGVPEVGDRFIIEIVELAEELSAHPERGRVVPEFNSSHLRELIHPPFRIIYRRFSNKVSAVCVWRSERLMQLP